MKILLCHNGYQQPGGEDQVFEDETWLLESRGHDVVRYTRSNHELRSRNPLRFAADTIWNGSVRRELSRLAGRVRPDVVHFTNTFPILSPAAYEAVRKSGAAVVQTLHNYRLLCPNAQFLRDGRVCEDCVGRIFAVPAIRHRCYRNSVAASAVVASMLAVHRLRGTFEKSVDQYVALTEFARRKFVSSGFPEERIVVKPNFVHPDPGPRTGGGGHFVFVGRLSPEKGVETLLAAWRRVEADVSLLVVGDGPLRDSVQSAAAEDRRIRWLGRRPLDEVLDVVGDASCLVMPSIWYETFGRTLVEAFAVGTPVIASRLGAMAELVDEGRTGLLFEPGNADDLAEAIRRMAADPTATRRMRPAARDEYEAHYTADQNYPQLIEIYERAIAHRHDGSSRRNVATGVSE